MRLRLALWNVKWATLRSARGREIRRILQDCDADLICLTEGYAGLLPESGYQILSDPDHGYKTTDGRRKVLLWSRWPWRDVDIVGSPELPPGRFARGRVSTPAGDIVVTGVCIPWAQAHVSTGRRDRKPWQDHEAYLDGLEKILRAENSGANMIVAGDFNQKLPAGPAPKRVRDRLMRTLGELNVCTTGSIRGVGALSLDHVAHAAGLVPTGVRSWGRFDADGRELSDHFGVEVEFEELR